MEENLVESMTDVTEKVTTHRFVFKYKGVPGENQAVRETFLKAEALKCALKILGRALVLTDNVFFHVDWKPTEWKIHVMIYINHFMCQEETHG